jgi:non-ribosomal peptide synthetase-like protein
MKPLSESDGQSDVPLALPLLHQRFAATVAAHPDRIAVEVPPGFGRPERIRWTYGELDRAAQSMARAVRARLDPAADEPIVAIVLGRDTPSLYAAQLAVLSAGAAFTCIDPKFPPDHVRAILDDAEVKVLLTDAMGRAWLAAHGVAVEHMLDVNRVVEEPEVAAIAASTPTVGPSRLAYLIYTSGTTGKPKGVEIEHRSIANLVDSDVEHFALGCEDRVAQCSSPAYDSSLEETWLAFAVGAALVPLDDETVRLGPDLVPFLQRERITVLCPPPTLLRTTGCDEPHRALPLLTLLYVGGEALPQDLADRWSRGRRLENGYGPTECTVTVVRTRIEAGKPVTIGVPVRGNVGHVVDDSLNEVADGELGELCIGGISLARGYRGMPEVTASRFVEHPLLGRLYRTGDLVRRNGQGDLEYHGRIDAQVKLRGYRVELGAVEACLAAFPGVREAACRVQGPASGQLLAAHVVMADIDDRPAIDSLKAHCRQSLPSYMVPSRFAFCEKLPRSVGGKLDRKELPEILAAAGDALQRPTSLREPATPFERLVAEAFALSLHHRGPFSVDDDFFLTLGGDSLSAVGVICFLRGHAIHGAALSGVTVRDLYDARTVESLAARCTTLAAAHAQPRESLRITPERHRMAIHPLRATLVQAGFIAGSVAISGWIWYAMAFLALPAIFDALGVTWSALFLPAIGTLAMLLWTPIAVGLTAITHRMVIGQAKPVRVPVWSATYVRYWMVEQVARLIPWGILEGTVFMGSALRFLGATVGKRVHVHRGVALGRGAWDLLTIGDDVTLSQEAALHLMDVDDGDLVVAPVSIGAEATIGVRAGVGGGATVGARATLKALAYLPSDRTIPVGEAWDGVPAQRVGESAAPAPPRDLGFSPVGHGLLTLVARVGHSLLLGLPIALATLLAEVLGGMDGDGLIAWLYDGSLGWRTAVGLLVLSLISVPLGLVSQAVALRCMGRVATGTMSRWGFDALRVWSKSAAVDAAGRWLSGSLYWPIWLRIAGMRIGRGGEVSTIIDVVPESVTIGDECFFADGIYFCSPEVHRGTITLGATSIGANTFLGNHAVVPGGAEYPHDLFIGVATVADPAKARPNTGWFGHPAMELPRRDVVKADRSVTHDPPFIRYCARLFWETLRFALPVVPTVVFLWWLHVLSDLREAVGGAVFIALIVPAVTFAALASLCGVIVLLKWALIARVKPGQHPLWSCWCSRWDFLFVAWSMYARNLLERLEGTVFLTWFLRAVGMRIGKNVVLGDGFAQVVDPDMLTFEDGATVTCNFQAHTFEDRILKIDHLVIRRNATVGHHTVVFYGADIGEGAHVEPHSVVMKQETLEAGGIYAGCPAARLG